jgi:uncharacterized membrane protein
MKLSEFIKMPQAETLHSFFSRFAFIFVIFSVISSGYITEVLSCQMRNYLNTSTYFRHLIGILMIFVFIMLEGGWSFDRDEDEKAENDWSSGDVLGSIGMALIIYAIFIISSKSQLIPNLIFFILLFILYLLNTQREYWYKRKKINDDTNQNILISEYAISGLAAIVMIYGFIDYIFYQKSQYKTKFRWDKFILGAHICAGSKNV